MAGVTGLGEYIRNGYISTTGADLIRDVSRRMPLLGVDLRHKPAEKAVTQAYRNLTIKPNG
jgi:hypothetical protein